MSEPLNFYEKIPKEFRKKYHNPNFKKHGLEIPFRAVVIGSSGAGKTNWLMNLIHITSGTFEHIAVCLKSKYEPLYEFLAKKFPESITFYENSVPDMAELERYKQSLIVFDDLVATKTLQGQIADYYIRGRKHGISSIYISQSYYGIPKIIRLQAQYIILKKVGSEKDLGLIMREYSFGISKEKLMELYEKATEKKESFLLLDLNAPNERKYRFNWNVIEVPKEPPRVVRRRKKLLEELLEDDELY